MLKIDFLHFLVMAFCFLSAENKGLTTGNNAEKNLENCIATMLDQLGKAADGSRSEQSHQRRINTYVHVTAIQVESFKKLKGDFTHHLTLLGLTHDNRSPLCDRILRASTDRGRSDLSVYLNLTSETGFLNQYLGKKPTIFHRNPVSFIT